MKLKGKNALITGGAQGIGKSIALAMAKEGAGIGIADINLESAQTTADEINALGVKSLALKLDVSRQENVAEAFNAFKTEFGTLDILINNAGITRDTEIGRAHV